MSAHCCGHDHDGEARAPDARYRRILWIALAVNAAMFVVEVVAGLAANSVALQADAIDFFADAANYVVSLVVLGAALHWRARAALLKGLVMAALALAVIGNALLHLWRGDVPQAEVIGVIGLLALAANVGVAMLLYRDRAGDANRMSVWLCTRNDAIANVAVVLAAAGVFGTASNWPDVVVAGVIAALGLTSGWRIARRALAELGAARAAPIPAPGE